MKIARLGAYLLLNIAVSAAVAVTVLLYWENNRQPVASRAPDGAERESGDVSLGLLAISSGQAGLQLSDEPIIYRVRAGDTMGSIAMQYEMTIEEIMAANGLNDPNALAVDQLLTIPGRQSAQPVITIRAVNGVGDLGAEQVVIMNVGGAADLGGWVLVHPEGDEYYFPGMRLHQTGQLSVNTSGGQDTVTELFWGRDQAFWRSGHVVKLLDADGNIHATFELP